MRLEAVAALLGHQTLQMTARYARIANRTVAAEYQAVTAKVEALYAQPGELAAVMRPGFGGGFSGWYSQVL